MQVESFFAYCFSVEAAGHQLEQRALAGHVLPEAVTRPFGALCTQAELGVDAPVQRDHADKRPDLPNLFRPKAARTKGGAILLPELAALRFLITQMCLGMRTSELLTAKYDAATAESSRADYVFNFVTARRVTRQEIPASQAPLMLSRERQVRRCVGVQSELLFCDFRGKALTLRRVHQAAEALSLGYSNLVGADASRYANPCHLDQGLRRSLSHKSLSTTGYYMRPPEDLQQRLEQFQSAMEGDFKLGAGAVFNAKC